MNLCKFKHALGVPGVGTHSLRIVSKYPFIQQQDPSKALVGLAFMDVLFTLIGVLVCSLIAVYFSGNLSSFFSYFILFLVIILALASILHTLFCIRD